LRAALGRQHQIRDETAILLAAFDDVTSPNEHVKIAG
jgi:hypothetical protein